MQGQEANDELKAFEIPVCKHKPLRGMWTALEAQQHLMNKENIRKCKVCRLWFWDSEWEAE